MLSQKKSKCYSLDFDKSSISWKLKSGSIGLFKIDSVLKIKNKKKLLYLGKAVIAGNVYGSEKLPKEPNYYFQISHNDSKSIIFRTSKENNFCVDIKKNFKIKLLNSKIILKKKKKFLLKS